MKTRWGVISALVLLLAAGAVAQDWTQHTVGSLTGAYGVWTADFDNDGDMDVTGCGANVAWFENQGDQTFTEHMLAAGMDTKDVATGDFNGDGLADVVVVSYTPGNVVAFLNNGSDPWDQVTVEGSFNGGYAVAADDIDNDGDIDIAGATWAGGDMAWWENDGTGTGWTTHSLTNGNYSFAHGVAIGDVSGDGLLDVVGSSGGDDNTAYWTNSGDDPWPQTVVGNGDYCSATHTYDIDGDGDEDIATAIYSEDLMVWYENDGNGGWTEYTVDAFFDGSWNVHLDDIDNDGDGDVVGGSRFTGASWWSNDDGTWTRYDLNANLSDVRGVYAADMDGDNDLDIIGAVAGSNALYWWEQPGEGQPDLVDLDADPQNPPINVPQGGSFLWSFHLAYDMPMTVNGWLWTSVELPNGQEFSPLQQMPWMFSPGQDFTINNITQSIPVFAPTGGYVFSAHAGLNTGNSLLSDSFTFTVIDGTGAGATDWSGAGLERALTADDDPQSATLPQQFEVSEAYPNPFNATSRVSVTLPDTRELTVRVHDTLGRLQAELAAGNYGAGTHHFTVDGSRWASGVYFVQVQAGGETALRKLVLVK